MVMVTHELPSIFAIADNTIYLDAEAKTMLATGDKVLVRESPNPKGPGLPDPRRQGRPQPEGCYLSPALRMPSISRSSGSGSLKGETPRQ